MQYIQYIMSHIQYTCAVLMYMCTVPCESQVATQSNMAITYCQQATSYHTVEVVVVAKGLRIILWDAHTLVLYWSIIHALHCDWLDGMLGSIHCFQTLESRPAVQYCIIHMYIMQYQI